MIIHYKIVLMGDLNIIYSQHMLPRGSFILIKGTTMMFKLIEEIGEIESQ